MPPITMGHITDFPPIGADTRSRRHVLPVRVLWTQGKVTNAEELLSGGVHAPCVLESTPDQRAAILLDFGQEINGGVCINLGYPKPGGRANLRVRFGESATEAMGEPNQDHGVHDWQISLPPISAQEIGLTGFRFVRIDLLDAPQSYEFRGVTAVALERDLPEIGHFECSDDLLNQTWRVGRRTVQLCMQNYLLDGIKRDRMVWMGDIHPQVGVIHHAYGTQKAVEESLDILRDRTPAESWMNGIPSYSAWWILSQHDWYWYTGRIHYLKQQHIYLSLLTKRLAGLVNDAGRLDWQGRALLDWASARDPEGTDTGLQSLGLWAFQASFHLAQQLGDHDLAQVCETAINKMKKAILPETHNKQATALRILTGRVDAKKNNHDVLAQNPAAGLSPWFGLYVLQARAAAGDAQGALDLIREYWGGMIKLGATSYWEHFDVNWLTLGSRIDELTPPGGKDVHADTGDHCFVGLRHSLCHGWGGGPTTYLSQYVLGVHPASPGYGRVRIAPMLGDLKWARGTIPTPHGAIRIAHERLPDGSINSQVELPKGCEKI